MAKRTRLIRSWQMIWGAIILMGISTGLESQLSQQVSTEVNVQNQDLLASPPRANWLSYNGDYSGRRFSGLTQITAQNVNRLGAEWVFHSRNSDRLEVTPVVVNGLMLVTSANDVFALDAATGRTVWHYARPISEGLIDDASRNINREASVKHDSVSRETENAHLLG